MRISSPVSNVSLVQRILVKLCPICPLLMDACNEMKELKVLYGGRHLTLLSFILELISMLVTVMGLACWHSLYRSRLTNTTLQYIVLKMSECLAKDVHYIY